jgi:hypothetical protein
MQNGTIYLSTLIFLGSCSSSQKWGQEASTLSFDNDSIQRKIASAELPVDDQEKLVVFYRSKLKSGLSNWMAQELDYDSQMPGGKPVDRFYNTHIMSATDSSGAKVYFRPVDTTTGCNSGCTPVVFHLQMDAEGRVTAIHEQDDFPLRKLYHQKFTQADKQKLLIKAQELPAALRYIEEPKQLTDSKSSFPPQTWSKFEAMHVKGGVYTSYRVYEAAMKSYQALNPENPKIKAAVEAIGVVLREYEKVDSVDTAKAFIELAINEISRDKSSDPAVKKTWITKTFSLLSQLQNNAEMDLSTYSRFFNSSEVKDYYRGPFCDLFLEATGEKSSRFAATVFENPDSFPQCEGTITKLTALTAYLKLKETEKAESIRRSIDFKKRPVFVLAYPSYLEFFAFQAIAAGFKTEGATYFSELYARYPKYPKSDKLPPLEQLLPKARKDYIKEYERSFLDPFRKSPAIKAHKGLNYEEKFSHPLPVKSGQANVVVFFASWCPHCKHKIESWAKSNFSEKFWNRIQLVEVFPKEGRTSLKDFCVETGMSASPYAIKCEEALRLDRNDEHNAFLDALEVNGIPSMAVFDGKGNLVTRTLELPDSEHADLERDVMDILELIDAR